ncbi:FAD-dependent oxidoreductase [Fusobacterium sp.]|uniref:NAD(P)/FAD-dependent oxidoreductase n=1 Tax=Fusobacterium sp. TaxID=68766 RepID=UPI002638EDE9|nr:FAD-dependent oxidoreductase [Fusobacterium sp.]
MEKIYDLVIIGGGPAGLTSAIYAGRSNLSVLVVEKENVGSLYMAHLVDNYPGFPVGISGKGLQLEMKKQALKYNVEFLNATFLGIDIYSAPKIVKTDKINVKANAIIIATGTGKFGGKKIAGEKEFLGKGVSYCATCDGAFTRNMTVSLFGQGDEVAEEALFLTKYSKEILIFTKDDTLQCNQELFDTLTSNEKVKIITNAELQELKGSEYLDFAVVKIGDEIKEYAIQYAFMYLGTKNLSELYGEVANLDKEGYIITDENLKTDVEGIFAAGDIRSKKIRQVTTAVSDGTIAGMEVIKYVLINKKKSAVKENN